MKTLYLPTYYRKKDQPAGIERVEGDPLVDGRFLVHANERLLGDNESFLHRYTTMRGVVTFDSYREALDWLFTQNDAHIAELEAALEKASACRDVLTAALIENV